jgi:hypothetical protein
MHPTGPIFDRSNLSPNRWHPRPLMSAYNGPSHLRARKTPPLKSLERGQVFSSDRPVCSRDKTRQTNEGSSALIWGGLMPATREKATRRALIPREFDRKEWPTPRAALALAIAIALVGKFEAAALRIFFQTACKTPRAVRTTSAPTGARSPDRLGALAARKWQLRTMRVVAPRRRLLIAGRRAGNNQNAEHNEA